MVYGPAYKYSVVVNNMLKSFFKCFGNTGIDEALHQLKDVCVLIQCVITKYDTEIAVVKRQCREAINRKESKETKLYYIRKIKMIRFHQDSARKRLFACTEKQYHLESLQHVSLHVEAIKSATHALKHVMKQTDIEKIEKLQDNLSELIDDAVEMQSIISQDIHTQHDWDDADLEQELADLTADSTLWPEVRLTPLEDDEVRRDTDVSTPLIQDYRLPTALQSAKSMELA